MNSEYRVLARKYRPKNLAELQGQDVLVKALGYAIEHNKLAQAYLLTGIRGIGKTTSARIIAKTINCEATVKEDNIILPCEKCSNCTSFNNNSHPDIMEIDAASRTGVDDVRVIIENSEYRPLLGRYKVFIIDEVHMLSKSAFNALLKLLEEPPAHVVFIFATTEVHKIPLTVISRCQRFDLARFPVPALVELFKNIARQEQFQFEELALEILAYKADGSARDGLSMLDQAVLLANNSNNIISKEIVENMLGVIDRSAVIKFISAVVNNNPPEALEILHNIYQLNNDLNIFINELLSLVNYLAKKQAIRNFSSTEFINFEEKLKELTEQLSMTWLQIAWQLIFKAGNELKSASNQLQLLEMLALKLIYANAMPKLPEANEERFPRQRSITPAVVTPKPIVKIAEIPTEVIIAAPIVEAKMEDINSNILEFLMFLNEKLEFDIYYFLLNMAEIVEFTENKLLIHSNNYSAKYLNEIKDLLKEWRASDWQVSIIQVENFTPFKQVLKDKFRETAAWQIIVKSFADAELSDILMQQ